MPHIDMRKNTSDSVQQNVVDEEAAAGGSAEVGANIYSGANTVPKENTGMDQAASKPVGKLDESVYKLFGRGSVSSMSRSSSDTGSEGLICNGGPGKICGNPVKEGEVGVLCDKCHEWFHASCQGIPKPAVKALDKYESLAWLCVNCKTDLKSRKSRLPTIASLEGKFGELEQAVRSHLELVSSSFLTQEKVMQDQASKLAQSMQVCEKLVKDQTEIVKHSVLQHKASYADSVKGTCNEVAKVVKSQLDSIQKVSNTVSGNKAARDLPQALDDHMDKERRKANLVIHNLPEQDGNSVAERSEKDVTAFVTMIRDVMKLHVASSKSFRVGKKHQDRPRLLIVTLDNPACKHDILKGAPQLRRCKDYENVYVTPDLTQKEREANRKLREELAARRNAGEANLTIRGGKIIQVTAHNRLLTGRDGGTRSQATQPTCGLGGSGHPAPAVLGSDSREQPKHQSSVGATQGITAPAALCSGSRMQHDAQPSTKAEQDISTPAVLSSGGRVQHEDQPSVSSVQNISTPAVLGSGSRVQCEVQPSVSSVQNISIPAVLGSGSRVQREVQSSVSSVQNISTPAVLGSGSRVQREVQPSVSSVQNISTPAVLGSGSGVQHEDQPSVRPAQGVSTPAVLGSGSGVQRDDQPSVRSEQDISAPAVLSSGSRLQSEDQPSTEHNHEM